MSNNMQELIGNDYLLIGTLERSQWRKAINEGGTYEELFDNLHDFEQVVIFEPHYGWRPNASSTADTDN